MPYHKKSRSYNSLGLITSTPPIMVISPPIIKRINDAAQYHYYNRHGIRNNNNRVGSLARTKLSSGEIATLHSPPWRSPEA